MVHCELVTHGVKRLIKIILAKRCQTDSSNLCINFLLKPSDKKVFLLLLMYTFCPNLNEIDRYV